MYDGDAIVIGRRVASHMIRLFETTVEYLCALCRGRSRASEHGEQDFIPEVPVPEELKD